MPKTWTGVQNSSVLMELSVQMSVHLELAPCVEHALLVILEMDSIV